ncbi:tumor necrosis factor receptor superfamily member 5 isoform X2 [Nycticebus coucang]|uniref:tumor necrosis factor receptor superfamily member 5 isoform X2 n=1 Tax=Nycticebus coucang TaxID=9470 RepID=UPI00234E33A6|nr:tumor necrosis factor receptor superfamily member 5 isoform X2 [Nycticebus coucang]
MVRLPLQCVLWSCLLTTVHPEPPTACRENQYLINSQCCSLCRPGEKLVDDCTEVTDTKCHPCRDGEFLDIWNRERYCHQHKHCDHNQGLRVLTQGTSKTDTVCICEEGRHCTDEACESCVPHSLCDPGFGVKQIGTSISDTICEPCPLGFFSSVFSPSEKCRPWTRCEIKGLIEKEAGTNKTDVVCDIQWRSRILTAVLITIGILCAVIFFVFICIRKVVKKPKYKVPQSEAMGTDPQETVFVEDPPVFDPAAPVQETLHGCQPVTQEDGKESRISVQERQ